MKNGIAQITTGQFAEFAGSVIACLPREGFNAQYYIENPSALRALLREAFVPRSVTNIAYTKHFISFKLLKILLILSFRAATRNPELVSNHYLILSSCRQSNCCLTLDS